MGIYVFTAAFLIDELRRSAEGADPGHDFGQHFLPRIIGREAVRAFTFSGRGTGAAAVLAGRRDGGRVLPGEHGPAARDPGAGPVRQGVADLQLPAEFPPPRVAVVPEPAGRASGGLRHNIFANGTVSEGWVRGSVVGFDCRVERDAIVEDSILFDGVSVGRGRRCGGRSWTRGAGRARGADRGRPGRDPSRGFVVSEGGVTCVPADTVVEVPGRAVLERSRS